MGEPNRSPNQLLISHQHVLSGASYVDNRDSLNMDVLEDEDPVIPQVIIEPMYCLLSHRQRQLFEKLVPPLTLLDNRDELWDRFVEAVKYISV
jgi:hypothetical protein